MRYTMYKYSVYILLLLSAFSYVYAQSVNDLQKLKAEYDNEQKMQSQVNTQTIFGYDIDPITGLPQKAQISPYKLGIEKDSLKIGIKHFGYDFFTRRDTIAFWENLPATANYLL